MKMYSQKRINHHIKELVASPKQRSTFLTSTQQKIKTQIEVSFVRAM